MRGNINVVVGGESGDVRRRCSRTPSDVSRHAADSTCPQLLRLTSRWERVRQLAERSGQGPEQDQSWGGAPVVRSSRSFIAKEIRYMKGSEHFLSQRVTILPQQWINQVGVFSRRSPMTPNAVAHRQSRRGWHARRRHAQWGNHGHFSRPSALEDLFPQSLCHFVNLRSSFSIVCSR